MSDIRRTVDQLMQSSDARSRLFAVDLLMRHSGLFDPADLAERLKVAALDTNADVVKKAKLSMSVLLKEGFQEESKLREIGIHSRMMNLTETELEGEQHVRLSAAAILAPCMERISPLALRPGPLAEAALEVIGASRDLTQAGVFIEATNDARLKTAAYAALRQYRIPEGVELVASIVSTHRTEEDLVAAARILGDLALPQGVGLLKDMVPDPSPHVRQCVAEAFGKIKEGCEEHVLGLVNDPSPQVQASAIAALAHCGTSKSVDALLAAFPSLKHPESIAQALQTFGRLRSKRPLPLIHQGLASPLTAVKVAAVQALARHQLKPEEVQEHLAPLVRDPEFPVRVSAIAALYPHDHQKASTALRSMLASKLAAERTAAMSIMGDIQDPVAMEDFLVAVNTEQDRAILATGLEAIDRIADPRLKKSLQRLLTHPNGNVQVKALRAYARVTGPVAVKDLDKLYDAAKTELVRSAILSTLGEICETGNISCITKHLKESDEKVVATAIEALDRVGAIENSMILEPFLSHPSPRVRASTIVALFHTGNFRSVSALAEMLGKSDEATVRPALHAVKRIHESLAWQDIQKRPLLLSPLMAERPAQPTATGAATGGAPGPLGMSHPLVIPKATSRIALDRTLSEERDLVKAVLAQVDGNLAQSRDHLGKVLSAQPDNELALYLERRMPVADAPGQALPATILIARRSWLCWPTRSRRPSRPGTCGASSPRTSGSSSAS